MRGFRGWARLCAATACVSSACIASPVAAPTAAPIRYPVAQGTRRSGLRVVTERAPDFGVAGAVLVVGCGSADEAPAKAGLAHLVEHLVFRSRRGDTTFERRLRAVGAGALNAMTGWDETTYYAFGPARALPPLVDLFAQVLDDPLAGVDDADFEHERQIVTNELRSHAENGTPGQAFGLLAGAVFRGQAYAHPVVGTEQSIAELTLADAREFAKTHYRVERSALTVTSPTPAEEQEALIASVEAAHPWAERAGGAPVPPPVPAQGGQGSARELAVHELPVATPTLWLGWAIPPRASPESDIAELLTHMVDSVFWRHVYDHDSDIAYVDADVAEGAQASLFFVRATLKEGRDPKWSADSLVQTMLHGLSEEIYGPQEFEYYKSNAATSLVAVEEPIVSRTLNLAKSMRMTGVPTFLRSRAERTNALSSGAAADFYHRYLRAEQAYGVFIRPLGSARSSSPAVRGASRASVGTEPPPTPPSPADIRAWMREPGIGKAKQETLDNGLRVVVLPMTGSPFHSILLAYHGGSAAEGVPGAALASLWAKQHFRVAAGTWGIEYHDRVDRDLTTEFLRATGSDLRSTLRQLHAQGEYRVFWPPDQFSSRLAAYERQDASPASVFEREMGTKLFGDHPYGRVTTSAALRAVRPNDVYAFLDKVHRADNALVVVVGDLDPAAAVEVVRSELGSMGRGRAGTEVANLPVVEQAAVETGSRILVQNRPGSDDATMRFSCILPPVDRETAPAAWLFADAADAVFRGELRERTASSYSVSGRIEIHPGGTAALEISSDVDPLHLPFSVQAVRKFVETPSAALFDDKLLAIARGDAARGFNLFFDTTQELAWRVASLWNVGWPLELHDQYPEAVNRVDVAAIVRLAERCRHNWVAGWLGDERRIRDAIGDWSP